MKIGETEGMVGAKWLVINERDRYRVPSRIGRILYPPPFHRHREEGRMRERNALDTNFDFDTVCPFIFVRTPVSFRIIDRSANRVWAFVVENSFDGNRFNKQATISRRIKHPSPSRTRSSVDLDFGFEICF